MEVKKRIKLLIACILMTVIVLPMSRFYSVNATVDAKSSDTITLGATLWRSNTEKKDTDESDFMAYKSKATDGSELRVWKLVQQTGDETTMDASKSIYCLKAGIGFTGMLNTSTYTTSGQEYNKHYNMYDKDQIKTAMGWDDTTYNKVLWIIDHMYVKDVGTNADKENLLKSVTYTDAGTTKSIYEWMETDSTLDDLTDNDIEVVQQMALWYYTNSDEAKYHDELATNFTTLLLGFKDSMTAQDPTSDEWKSMADLYDENIAENLTHIDYGTWRLQYASALFKYFIDNADENYTPSNTSKTKATFWTYEGDDGEERQPVVIIEKGNFDLALRKFITKVSDGRTFTDTYFRVPSISQEQIEKLAKGEITTVEKEHTKEPVEVKTGDIVTYTIRIYNEGDISGYANEVTDYLPSGLEFIPALESTINNAYNWKCYDGKTVTTDYLKDKLIESFNGTEIKYVDLQIECKVVEENSSAQKTLKNVAEITKAQDVDRNDMNATGDDRDSTPSNLTDSQKQNYNPGESEKGWGYEDDDDYEDLVLPGKQVDFALRKFITAVGDNELLDEDGTYSREPEVLTSTIADTGTATYNHTKVPLTVKVGDVVTYTIRVYNEGEVDGYISEITDHLPEWLDFIYDDPDNINYQWEIEDDRTIKTSIISKAKESSYLAYCDNRESRGTTLLNKWDGTENKLDYIDVKIKCRVNESAQQGIKMTNIAEITGMTDSEGTAITKDRDSGVLGNDLADIPSDENLPDYKQKEINAGQSYIEGQQDDDDFEKVIVQVFDLRLRKFITAVDDEEVTDRYPQVSYKENPTTDTNLLEYTHPKKESPVGVVKGNVVTYTLRVYNEGDIAGFAEEITDYLEDAGLKYLPDNEINKTYGWKMIDENGNETADVTKAVKVVTDYLKYTDGKENLINAFDKNAELSDTDLYTDTDTQNPDYKDVKIAFEVIEENESQRILENAAEISKNTDEEGNTVTDVDSTADRTNGNDIYQNNGNGANDEDDYDKDYVRLNCFDLALRKFITDVSGMPVNNRYPSPRWDNTLNRIVYDHTKTPVEVAYGDVVTYTIRVYNEGSMAGFAQEVTDDLPDYLTYLPDNEINKQYGWVMRDADGNEVENVEDAVCITTDYLSKDNGTTIINEEDGTSTNSNLLKAFNKEEAISDTNPDYREIKVAMRVDLQVTQDNLEDSKRILINEAQISEDADENGDEVKDIDSVPDRDDQYNYDGDNEDDIDYEPVKVKYFDLALQKWVTQAIVTENGTTTVTESGHTGDEDPEPALKVEIKSKQINKVNVKFKFKIKVTNQGEIEGYAKEVTDHIPEGLEFVQSDNPDWYVKDGNLVATRALENTLLEPGESATVEIVLQWINGNSNFGVKTNYAEISEDYNASNTPDIDSTPGNLNGEPQEDDEDKAPVVLSIKTGEVPMYFALTGSMIGMFAGGVLMIKRYVI